MKPMRREPKLKLICKEIAHARKWKKQLRDLKRKQAAKKDQPLPKPNQKVMVKLMPMARIKFKTEWVEMTYVNGMFAYTEGWLLQFDPCAIKEWKPLKERSQDREYKANFLWPHEDGSVEALGYEFANAIDEDYRRECWEELIKKAKQL